MIFLLQVLRQESELADAAQMGDLRRLELGQRCVQGTITFSTLDLAARRRMSGSLLDRVCMLARHFGYIDGVRL